MNTPSYIVHSTDPYKTEANIIDFMALHLEGCGATVGSMIVICSLDFGHMPFLCSVRAVPTG
jgi:hypothetical protein